MTTAARRQHRAGPRIRLAALVTGAALALTAVAGCGGDDAAEPEDTASGTDAAGEPEETEVDYLPAPDGVELTAPGTELELGQPATIAWRPRQDTVVTLEVTVERIDRTTYRESFDGWAVTRQMRKQAPYFVRATATNVGDTAVGGLSVPLYGVDESALMVEALGFRERSFKPCPGGELPKRLPPGEAAALCLVYLVPADREFAAVAFDPVDESPAIAWTGEITEIETDKRKRKSGKGKKND